MKKLFPPTLFKKLWRDCERVFIKLFLGILILFNFAAITAAEKQSQKRPLSPAALEKSSPPKKPSPSKEGEASCAAAEEETYTVTIEGQESSFEVSMPKNTFQKIAALNMPEELCSPEEEGKKKTIYLQQGHSQESFKKFIHFLKTDDRKEKLAFLQESTDDQITSLLYTMNALGVMEEEMHIIIAFILKFFTNESFEEMIANHTLQNNTTPLFAVLKKLQLAALINPYAHYRTLEHPMHLSEFAVVLLKENNLWHVAISITDLTENETTRPLLEAEILNGKTVLRLIERHLTSLQGIESIGNLDAIQSIDLDDNLLTSIDFTLLERASALEVVSLFNNRLTAITPFPSLPELKVIHLTGNQLVTLDPTTFAQLPKLEGLYLHSNALTEIDPVTFACLPHLQELWLHENPLTEENKETIRKVLPVGCAVQF